MPSKQIKLSDKMTYEQFTAFLQKELAAYSKDISDFYEYDLTTGDKKPVKLTVEELLTDFNEYIRQGE